MWAFPHFSMLAQQATAGPLLLFSNIDPQYPGMVAMLAAGGSLDQVGRHHERVWGEITEEEVGQRVEVAARAAHAVRQLEGMTFGRIGGRSMGMYTAVGRTDEWMSRFGIDVEEIDQWEIVRRSELVEASHSGGTGVAGETRRRCPLRRQATDARTPRAPGPVVLRDP